MPTTAGVSKYFARGNRIVFAGWGFGSVFRDLHRELQSTHCPATGKTQNPLVAIPCRFESGHRHQIECSLRIRNFFEGTLLRNVLCRNRTAAMNWPLSVKQNAWKEPCWIMPTIAAAAAVAPGEKGCIFWMRTGSCVQRSHRF